MKYDDIYPYFPSPSPFPYPFYKSSSKHYLFSFFFFNNPVSTISTNYTWTGVEPSMGSWKNLSAATPSKDDPSSFSRYQLFLGRGGGWESTPPIYDRLLAGLLLCSSLGVTTASVGSWVCQPCQTQKTVFPGTPYYLLILTFFLDPVPNVPWALKKGEW